MPEPRVPSRLLSRFLVCWIVAAAVIAPDGFAQDATPVSFVKTVTPMLKEHCFDCHEGDDAEANLDLRVLSDDFSTDETANRWVEVMHALRFDNMPPQDEPQPTANEKADVIDWVLSKMSDTNRFDAYQKKAGCSRVWKLG